MSLVKSGGFRERRCERTVDHAAGACVISRSIIGEHGTGESPAADRDS
jgi:hypothetical protein